MTPPDSGERQRCVLVPSCSLPAYHDGPHMIAKPDSGEREVERCRWRHAVAGQCVLPRGHDGWHESQEAVIAEATIPIPLPLAQRILAALEESLEGECMELARELRAAVERKP